MELAKVFLRDTPEEKRLFELLRSAYVEARYNDDFVVTKEDIDALTEQGVATLSALLRQTYKLTKENNTPQTGHKQAGAASRTQNRTKTTAEGRSADFNPVYQNGRDPSA